MRLFLAIGVGLGTETIDLDFMHAWWLSKFNKLVGEFISYLGAF